MRVAAALEPETPDVVFERKLPERSLDPAFLGRYVGTYAYGEGTGPGHFTVALDRGRHVVATFPGQTPYELRAISETEFKLMGLDGFRLRFEPGKDSVTAEVVQPNGVVRARRQEHH